MIQVVAGLCLNKSGQALMTLRPDNVECPNMWEWPGGKVEVGERDIEALHREWEEELGVRIIVGPLVAFGSLWVKEPFTLTLYQVSIHESGVPKLLDYHTQLTYAHPLQSVTRMTCTPMTYVLHHEVLGYTERYAALCWNSAA